MVVAFVVVRFAVFVDESILIKRNIGYLSYFLG